MEFKTFTARAGAGSVLPLASAKITVAGTITLASIFDDDGLAVANPITASEKGIFAFAAENGEYDITLTPNGGVAELAMESVTFFDSNSNEISLADFNANSDGTADASVAVQAFFDAIAGSTGTVPDGIYLASAIAINSGCTVRMSKDARFKLPDASNDRIFYVNADEVHFFGGVLDANRSNNPTTARCVEVPEPQNDVTFEGVHFTGYLQDAIKWDGGNNLKVRNNRFTDGTNGALQAIIMKNDADGATDATGMEIVGNTCVSTQTTTALNHFKVRGNFKWDGATTANTKVVRGLIFANNTMISAVSATGNGGAEFSRGVIGSTVSGNHFYGGKIGLSLGSFFSQGDHLQANDAGFTGTATGNTFEAQSDEAVELTVHTTDTVVVGNTIRKGAGTMLKGILVNSPTCNGNLIEGNTIEDADTYAIHSTNGADAVQIRGNKISAPSATNVIMIEGVTEKTAVCGNTIDGGGAAAVGVLVESSDGVTVQGNDFFDLTSNGVRFNAASAHTFDSLFVAGNTQDGGPLNVRFLGTFTVGSNVQFRDHITQYHTSGDGALANYLQSLSVTTTGTNANTLANGAEGQELTIYTDNATAGTATVTPANARNFTSFALAVAGDTANLKFSGGQWSFIGGTATIT